MMGQISRREFLGTAVAAGVAGSLGPSAARAAASTAAQAGAPEPFRFVHLTDIHVQPELRAGEGLCQCLAAVEELRPRPDFIFTGGDLVMDVFEQDAQRSRMLFELYRKALADHTGIPVRQCIGNHDVFGWAQQKGVTPQTAGYGKQMISEMLDLPRTYYHFDHKGWRFLVLDDIQPAPDNGYQAYIDEAQWAWLEDELASKDPRMPAAIVCHIPVLTITALDDGSRFQNNAYNVPTSLMCRDAFKLADLFSKHNVRLALSGHIHQFDRIEFRGVSFICDGAVCGAWWKGPHKGIAEGFGVLDLSPDGTIQHRYAGFGWKAQA